MGYLFKIRRFNKDYVIVSLTTSNIDTLNLFLKNKEFEALKQTLNGFENNEQ